MTKLDAKREKEKDLMNKMISIYCKGHHKNHNCESCKELLRYATDRIDRCPFMETKTFCSQCKVHCYNKEHRDRVKSVMKYSGPRMIFTNPGSVISHMIETLKSKGRTK
ncbi:nitrous oxide-stimulated promoter family protein [Anaerorhabdus sp.]|uniref:nitrous oxide-stimulated promoter family protein n=1 Tax=Anaerorhabdus sp. TaxID=1872524 RepID=UPI002FC67B8C